MQTRPTDGLMRDANHLVIVYTGVHRLLHFADDEAKAGMGGLALIITCQGIFGEKEKTNFP